jgi:hypothetical protein
VDERGKRLEKLYFEGHGNVAPVVHIANYGDNRLGAGQVRTNQFVSPAGSGNPWTLREFKLRKTGCPSKFCSLKMLPVSVKNNPFGPLFAGTAAGSAEFERLFAQQNVASLSAAKLADIAMTTPEKFNAAQSNSNGSTENDYPAQFASNTRLATALRTALGVQSTLTPAQLVARAGTQSCAGCHQLSNGAQLGNSLVWPSSLGFVHVSERQTEVVGGVTRFVISPALVSTFLPARKARMEAYLRTKQ